MPQVLTSESERLALHGGAPALQVQPAPRERWGDLELRQLASAIEQPSLFYWNGPQTKLLVERFREHYPLEHVMPCSSGTAALHIAVAAAGVGPGDEVIVPPITDMGTVIGVLYQQGVPVFADLDPRTYHLDPQSVREKITPKTKAIIAVQLTGNPCDMDALKALADEHDLVLIEDCAQAWGAMYRGTPVGTIGHIGCWSLNDFKHIGCGDGGIVASSDERFGPLLQKFGDKAYDRSGGARMPDVLAPNYRISELQSAVAAAQMTRMEDFTAKRAEVGRVLNECLADVPGVLPPRVNAADHWTCWFYMLRVEEEVLGCDSKTFAEALAAEGVPCGAGYLTAPLYQYPLFANENFFAGRWPVKELGLTQMDYNDVCCPETEAILASCVTIATHEGHSVDWAKAAGDAVRKVANYFASENSS
jgi:dTDP-4-amino-4,6-dideoxygalactose transaminase